MDKYKQHIAVFDNIWETFADCATEVVAAGGYVCNEWPTGCAYWHIEKVETFFKSINAESVNIHGCKLGLVSVVNSLPILKPWTLKTNCHELIQAFNNTLCDRKHKHTPCAGRDTRLEESYTPEFCKRVHCGWR